MIFTIPLTPGFLLWISHIHGFLCLIRHEHFFLSRFSWSFTSSTTRWSAVWYCPWSIAAFA